MTKNKLRSLLAGSVLLSLASCSLLFTLPADSLDRTQVNTDQAQTITNKTLLEPIIATIRNTGLLTLPTSTDTLVGRATTDSLTNKTLESPTIVTPSITNHQTTTGSNAPFIAIDNSSLSSRQAFLALLGNGGSQWLLSADIGATNAQEFSISDSIGGVRLLIDTNGVLDVRQGQIKFPATQVASADANTLDDYEEGPWTPSVGGNATYTTQAGHYTKIGREVTLECDLAINVIGTGSTTEISGVPTFGGAVTANGIGAVLFFNLANNKVTVVARVPAGGTVVELFSQAAAGASLGANAIMGNGTTIQFTIKYMV